MTQRNTERRTRTQLAMGENELRRVFGTFEVNFIPAGWIKMVNETVQETLINCWESVVALAREGYVKHGRGYVKVKVNCFPQHFQSSEQLVKPVAEYVAAGTPRSLIDSYYQVDVSGYDPECEVVFAIQFKGGVSVGKASIETRFANDWEVAA